jgi:hypothetical protein
MDPFKSSLERYFKDFFSIVATKDGDWTVKGFIDVYKNIYTISVDTKVVSKIIELMIFPAIVKFARENAYEMVLASHQNHYPDISFVSKKTKEKIALDLKSTYRINSEKVNGMTLGAFTGYFRNRKSTKNITFPYSDYSKHYVLGILYTQTDMHNAEKKLKSEGINLTNAQRKALSDYFSSPSDESFGQLVAALRLNDKKLITRVKTLVDSCFIDEKKKFKLDDLPSILSVVRDFDFFLQEKWRIAIDRPGSGNTKNIGSTTSISELKEGSAIFTRYKNGKKLFDDFWMNYLTKDMANAIDLDEPPYSNLKTYFEHKGVK